MAKRFTISLPDELARRIEPFKDQLSLSAIMQKSLEAELAELVRPEEEKAKAKVLLRLAEEFYKEDFSALVNAVTFFLDYQLEKAIQDSDKFIFRLYGLLKSESLDPYEALHDSRGELSERIEAYLADEEYHQRVSSEAAISAVSALCTFWQSDPEVICEDYPADRPWNDADFLRVMGIVLREKLQSLLGAEAMQNYLTWHPGFPDPWIQGEQHQRWLQERGE